MCSVVNSSNTITRQTSYMRNAARMGATSWPLNLRSTPMLSTLTVETQSSNNQRVGLNVTCATTYHTCIQLYDLIAIARGATHIPHTKTTHATT